MKVAKYVLFAILASAPVPAAMGQAITLQSPTGTRTPTFGATVASIPDLDGDSIDDLAVGALNDVQPPDPHVGLVHVYSGRTGELIYSLVSPGPNQRGGFGWYIAGLKDIDGDQRGDIIVGVNEGIGGLAYVFSGSTGQLVHTLRSPNEQPGGRFGSAVGAVDDINGDGRGDILVGAEGENGEKGSAY